jgi:hypothetical protein
LRFTEWRLVVTRSRKHDPTQDDHRAAAQTDPTDWVKPVELIELLARRTAKRKQPEAPTSSPFYDAEFVASHRKRRTRGPS